MSEVEFEKNRQDWEKLESAPQTLDIIKVDD